MTISRRDALTGALAGSAIALGNGPATSTPSAGSATAPEWKRGFDNQRIADLGDGRFLNPLIAGDRPDPAILKDGADYYLTFSTFDSYPGITIWHSRDLINWQPRGAALTQNIGSVWAVSLEKHEGRYFIYIPVKAQPNSIFVIHANSIDGPLADSEDGYGRARRLLDEIRRRSGETERPEVERDYLNRLLDRF